MSVMSEIERIKNAKTALKTSIENKDVEVGDGLIDTYASKVDMIEGSDSHNAFEVSSVAEMNELTDVNDGDFCTIYGETLVGMTEATSTNVERLVVNSEISLSEEITSLKTLDLMVMGAGDRFVCNIYPVGMMIQYDIGGGQQTIQYTSADGINYTTSDFSGDLELSFNNAISASSWDNVFTEIVMIPQTVFGGIYQASVVSDVVTWNLIIPGSSGGDYNAYKVATIQDRNALTDIQDKDICIVQNSTIAPMTEATSTNVSSIYIPESVTLPEALTGQFYGYFYAHNDSAFMSVNINSTGTNEVNVYTSYYDDSSGGAPEERQFIFTSLDDTNFTLSSTSDPSGLYNLQLPVSYENYEPWDDKIGLFIETGNISFSGIYQASVEGSTVNWNYLAIGSSASPSDITLSKTAYTDNGFVTGTVDPDLFVSKGFVISQEEPSPAANYPIWIKPYTYWTNNYHINNSLSNRITTKSGYFDTTTAFNGIVSTTVGSDTYTVGSVVDPSGNFYCMKTKGSSLNVKTYEFLKIAPDGTTTVLANPPSSNGLNKCFWNKMVMGSNPDIIYFLPVYGTNNVNGDFYKYTISTNTFTALRSMGSMLGSNKCLVYHHRKNAILVMQSDGSSDLHPDCYTYSISNNNWSTDWSYLSSDEKTFANKWFTSGRTVQGTAIGPLSTQDYIYWAPNIGFYKETNYALSAINVIDTATGAAPQYIINYCVGQFNSTKSFYYYRSGTKDLVSFSLTKETVGGTDTYYMGDYEKITNIYNDYSSHNLSSFYFDSTNAKLYMLLNYQQWELGTSKYYIELFGAPATSGGNVFDSDATNFALGVTSAYTTPYSIAICGIGNSGTNSVNDVYLVTQYTDINRPNYENAVEKVYIYNNNTEQYDLLINKLHDWEELTEERHLCFRPTIQANLSSYFTYKINHVDTTTEIGTIVFAEDSGGNKLTIDFNYGGYSLSVTYSETESGTFTMTERYINGNQQYGDYGELVTIPYDINVVLATGQTWNSEVGKFLQYRTNYEIEEPVVATA